MALFFALALAAQQPPTLAVDAGANRHPISPYIYGINAYADNGLASIMHIPLRRWGGDATTSYNWKIDVSNSASDWYFQNGAQTSGSQSNLPNGSSFDLFHEANLRTGTLSLGTISLMDWTPKDDYSCSFSVAKYGAQQKVDPYQSDCGNGMLTSNGQQIVNDPTDAYEPTDPAYPQSWIGSYLVPRYGPGNAGGVTLWSMDNEPEWWYGVHIDIFQQPGTYDDTMSRNLKMAQAVKAADPTALVDGPVPAGWLGYFYSRTDMQSGWSTAPYQYWDNPTDQAAHGGLPWLAYYLQQMNQFEQQHRYRLLDVLDVHGYLEPDSLDTWSSQNNDAPGDAQLETLRMTSTRAFWDPNYIVPMANASDNLYDNSGNIVAPQLIPRMQQWVNQYYPGTKIGITEYWWHALGSITGAIAQADILGIFGSYALDYGTLWGPPAPTDPGAFAFKIFLNYDGNGNQFGGESVSATTSNPDTLSIYAALRYDSALTILVLNKTASAITDSISLANFTPAGTAQLWQYSNSNLSAIMRQSPDLNVSAGTVAATFAPYSMNLLVIPQAQSAMAQPQPMVAAVTNAASYDATAVSPGEIVTIWGQNLAPAALANLQVGANGVLSNSIGGVQVFFNGYAAPIIYTLANQMSAIVPYEIAGQQSVNVVVVYQGNASAPFSVPVAPAKPGIFTVTATGQGAGAILNQDYTLNSPANPVPRGEYLFIYGTGEGLTNPPGLDGRISTTPLPTVNLACAATIGGQQATLNYCGEAPGFTAGLVQVNALVPDSVTPGATVPVTISINGVTSQTGVTVAVK